MATFSLPIIRKEPLILSVALGYDSILRLAAECARVVPIHNVEFVKVDVDKLSNQPYGEKGDTNGVHNC